MSKSNDEKRMRSRRRRRICRTRRGLRKGGEREYGGRIGDGRK